LTITATTLKSARQRRQWPSITKARTTIAFNPQYLMDPLRNLDADEVFMELTDELSPAS